MLKTESYTIPDDIERIIVVSDPHALIRPLKAVDEILDMLREKFLVVAAGDYFVNGLQPCETLDWVRCRCGKFAILGNHDQGGIAAEDETLPLYTEGGGYATLSDELKAYLAAMPHILELTWRGKQIRIAHDQVPAAAGRPVAYRAAVPAVVEYFADPSVDLTVCAHTHFPFVEKLPDTIVANTGGTSCLLFGYTDDEGTIHYKGREGETYEPVDEIYGTYLSIVLQGDELAPTVERFTYDFEADIRDLEATDYPTKPRLSAIYRSGIEIQESQWSPDGVKGVHAWLPNTRTSDVNMEGES